MILEIERVRTRSHTVENSPRKSLWICCQTDYGINECEREGHNLYLIQVCYSDVCLDRLMKTTEDFIRDFRFQEHDTKTDLPNTK